VRELLWNTRMQPAGAVLVPNRRTDMWTNGTKLPPLVHHQPPGHPRGPGGVLPAATILYGDQTIGDDGRGGLRATIGTWLDACHVWNLEFDYFMLGRQDNGFTSGFSTGNPILARPFFNVETNAQASELVAYTNQVEGTVAVGATNNFYSVGTLLSYNLCSCDSCGSCDSCNDSCGGASCGGAHPAVHRCCSVAGPTSVRLPLLRSYR